MIADASVLAGCIWVISECYSLCFFFIYPLSPAHGPKRKEYYIVKKSQFHGSPEKNIMRDVIDGVKRIEHAESHLSVGRVSSKVLAARR